MRESAKPLPIGEKGPGLNLRDELAAMVGSKDVSILIVNWNSKDYLRKCLASIYRETRGLEFEVIVVDNASWDGAAELVATEFPGVKFIQSDANLGFARANNLAFGHSVGKAVLLLNPDTEVLGSAIATMLDTLRSLSDAGIVGCKNLHSDLTVQTYSIRRFPTILEEVLAMEWIRNAWPKCRLWSIEVLFDKQTAPIRVDAVTGACQMIWREVYEAVDGLSTKYFMYSEDLEISASAMAKGWKTYYAGNAEIIHHGGKSSQASGRGDRWVSFMQSRAMWQFHRTWRGKGYAGLYRLTIGVVSLVWVTALVVMWPFLLALSKKDAAERAWGSRTGALQWSLGFERPAVRDGSAPAPAVAADQRQ
ncbi:MAG TPA: glycosyltransferase family 2 protein [Candidatus Dormibacteraeota bacterium]|nr:glycosyltransferase family 2 protein [Candidatus Dormibacteraeota bacterium]